MDSLTGAAGPLSNPPAVRREPQSCSWGIPTLYLDFPAWLSAWDAPWTCRHPAHAGPIETTEFCTTCPHWLCESALHAQRK